jgi:hypothetical protein
MAKDDARCEREYHKFLEQLQAFKDYADEHEAPGCDKTRELRKHIQSCWNILDRRKTDRRE